MPLSYDDAAVAQDVLLERFSPVKPYDYRWDARMVLAGPPGSRLLLEAMLSSIVDGFISIRVCASAELPPLDFTDLWAPIVDDLFHQVERDRKRAVLIDQRYSR